VSVETDPEIFRLRELLRDLVALSAIPAVWVERAATVREPGTKAVAAELADSLVRLLQLDFAFVRLSDPGGAGAAEVTRGGAWKRFPEWLEGHLVAGRQFTRKELLADVGDGPQPCRGFAIPIGLHGEGGVVAAASERSDFPTATDQLLLSLAANQASTAFQTARLVHERTRAEEELREARDELELRVAERTADLGRSEAYLADAQRLTHTGSFAIDVPTREVTHSSDESSRLYGFDPEQRMPSLGELLERIHPQDRAMCAEALERGIREATNMDVEYRVVLPHTPVRRHRAIAHAVFDASGELHEVVGTVVDVTERRQAETELERLAGEQTALRQVATLVAREASQAEVFSAIAEGIGQLLGTEEIRMLRYEDDGSAVVVGSWGNEEAFPPGSRQQLEGDTAASRVLRTGRTARIDDYRTVSGPLAETVRSIGVRSAVGAPILVEGRLWGAIVTGSTQEELLPPDTESRLGQFTELMATAIANTEAHARANRLAEEQAALRRVATLVAKGSSPTEVFAKIGEEVANVIGDVDCVLGRDEGDGTVSVVAAWGTGMLETVRVGERFPVDGNSVVASVLADGRPCRIDDYSTTTGTTAERGRARGIRSAAGCPILVRGRTWGVVAVASYEDRPLPPATESHVAQFTDLVATAIANAEALGEVERLAEEQAALRRVAMLVAEGASPTVVFDAVTAEMERLLDADGVTLSRYEPGAEVTVVAHRGLGASQVPPGSRVRHEGQNVTTMVRRSERPARMESYAGTHGAIAELVDKLGVRASVGAPVVVGGKLWGVMIANWRGDESPPADTEERMVKFAELLDTATANADSRDQLTASRARLVTAGDEARRRVVRDLHDGAQQRLVHTIVTLKLAQRAFRQGDGRAESLLGEALEHAEQGNAELRELAHGILPTVLTSGGLRAGVEAVVARLDLPVNSDVPADRFPAEIEASAYFIVAEALTNVVKHSHAVRAEVRASVEDGMLHVEVRDDGIGGADPTGHGLVGIGDRATALGGRLEIESPAGGGTLVTATLPLSSG
jgi:signal transduction histidine kinase/PAS domain-containing protein